MIKEVQIKKYKLHFNQVYKIAYEEVVDAEVVVVKIIMPSGVYGLGNAAPDTEVTGETIENVFTVLKNQLTPDFFDQPLTRQDYYHEKIQVIFAGFPSACAAVEEAFLNLWSAQSGLSLTELWGGYRQKCQTMITIPIKNLEETIRDVKQRIATGFSVIKLKCGLDWQDDLVKIKAVREILPRNIKLILDANQGYKFAEARKLIQAIKPLDIALIEQPITAIDLAGLKKLHLLNLVPVVADEAVVNEKDALNLLQNNYVAGVNIKLMKCGGPLNFIKIFNLAKSLNKIIMLGCMYETNISMTTGAHLALALPIDYVDLDSGHLDFVDDPTSGGVQVENGWLNIKGPLKLDI